MPQRMDDMTKNLLRMIALTFPTVSPEERSALCELIDKGPIQRPVILNEPHLLTADQSAAWLGISTDSFARARKEYPSDLAANEIYPGHKRWCKLQLLAFAHRHLPKTASHASPEPEGVISQWR